MKTLHLAIITGLGITTIAIITITLIMQPPTIDADLMVVIDKNEYGVGEPISFAVETRNQSQTSSYPTASIVNEQNKVIWHDDDLPPNGYMDKKKEYYIQQDSENVPIINQTGKYTLLVTFENHKASKDFTITELINEGNLLHFYGPYRGIDNNNGTAEIVNQTYYITTVHNNLSGLTGPNDTTIMFHDVSFRFPGCGRCLSVPTVSNPPYDVRVQFSDKTNETLVIRANMWSTMSPPMDFHEYFPNGTKIFPNGTKSIWHMILHKDPVVTTLTSHIRPQAGITVTHDLLKFLVSTNYHS